MYCISAVFRVIIIREKIGHSMTFFAYIMVSVIAGDVLFDNSMKSWRVNLQTVMSSWNLRQYQNGM